MEQCIKDKILNPKTCRFVKKCKDGYKKNKKNRCIKITKKNNTNKNIAKNNNTNITKKNNTNNEKVIINEKSIINKGYIPSIKKNITKKNNTNNENVIINEKSIINKSYIPSINKYLIESRNSIKYDIFTGIIKCMNIDILVNKHEILDKLYNPIIELPNGKCVKYDNKESINLFIKNLSKYNLINPVNLNGPKQSYANCWFNTGLVIHYISDKGRKFNKYIRQYMISGNIPGLKKIKPKLHKTMFLFNIAIEAILEGHILGKLLNTNYLISRIFNDIPKKFKDKNIYDIKELGNPFKYQKALLNYIHVDGYKDCWVSGNELFSEYKLNNTFTNKKKDILWVRILDNEKIDNKRKYIKDKNGNKFILDSILIRDTKKSHFCCFITINKEEYIYDGASEPSISPYKWNNELINKDINISSNYGLSWNFMISYMVLVYYKI